MSPSPAAPAEDGIVGTRGLGGIGALGIGLFTAILAVAFESIAVNTVMPVAAADLGGTTAYTWAFTLVMIGQLGATVLGGRWCDRAGPVPALAVGVTIFTIGLIAAGAAPSWPALLAARFGQGLGAGFQTSGIFVLVARAWPPHRHPLMMSVISTGWVMPAFFGPPVAAWLTRELSWHWVFWSVLVLVALALGLSSMPLLRAGRQLGQPESDPDVRPVPLWTAAVLPVGLVATQFAGQQLRWQSVPLALVGLTMVVLASRQFLPRTPQGRPNVGSPIVAVFMTRLLVAGAFMASDSLIPLMLQNGRGVSPLWSGLVLTFGSVGWTAASYAQTALATRVARNRMIMVGAALVLVGLSFTTIVGATSLPPLLAILGAAVCGSGMGLAMPGLNISSMRLSRPAELGRNQSGLLVHEGIGVSVTGAAAGTVLAALLPLVAGQQTYALVLACVLVPAVLGVWSASRVPRTD